MITKTCLKLPLKLNLLLHLMKKHSIWAKIKKEEELAKEQKVKMMDLRFYKIGAHVVLCAEAELELFKDNASPCLEHLVYLTLKFFPRYLYLHKI